MSYPLLTAHPLLVTVVAEGPQNTGPDFGKASPVGLFVIVLLLLAVFALVWSMNRHLKKVPESFDEPKAGPGKDPAAATPPAAKTEARSEGESPGESSG